jgi:hypothetical protein
MGDAGALTVSSAMHMLVDRQWFEITRFSIHNWLPERLHYLLLQQSSMRALNAQ